MRKPQWLDLLREHTLNYAPQPWQQLAAVHRAAGHEREARQILIAQQDDRRRLLQPGLGAGRGIRARLCTYRAYLLRMLRLVVGYGYQTWRALVCLLLILIASAGLGLLAGRTHISPAQYVAGHTKATTNPGQPCSTVEQIGLGVDLGLPLIKTNVRARCDLDSATRPGQWIIGFCKLSAGVRPPWPWPVTPASSAAPDIAPSATCGGDRDRTPPNGH